MEKVVRDGRVAVLISPDYGSGWSTWNESENSRILLFHPKLVEMVETGRKQEITTNWMKETFGLDDIYCGGVEDLEIRWVPEGTYFSVNDYDGSEYLTTVEELVFLA